MVEFRKAVKKAVPIERLPGDAPAPPAQQNVMPASDFVFSSRPTTGRQFIAERTAQEIYLEGLALSAAVSEWAATGARVAFPLDAPLSALISDVANRLATDQAWTLLSLSRAASKPKFLPAHAMNTCILSTYIGMHSGMRDDQIISLANISFLHDIGVSAIPHSSGLCLHQIFQEYDLISDAVAGMGCCAKPDSDYFEYIKKHPLDSLKLIDAAGRIDDPTIALAAVEHHERVDGSGYPNRKTAKEVSLASSILAVADTYLGITHRTSEGRGIKPFDAIRTISQMAGRKLSMDATRKFLQVMSIYPIGSGVRLNNGVIARVTGVNEKQLTKPLVRVVSAAGESFAVDQIIDLASEKLLFIREPVCIDPLDPVFNIG